MAKKPPKKKSLANRYGSQIKAETSLRYDPQRAELGSTLKDLRDELGAGVSRAHASAEGIRLAAKAARPDIAAAAAEGTKVADAAQSDLSTKLGQIPGGGLVSSLAARDAEGTKRRLGEMLARAKTDLTTRQTDAASGEALQVGNLQAGYTRDAGRVRDKLQSLAGEEGAYAAARSGELTEGARDRRNKRLTSGVDASGKVIPGGPKDPKLKPGKKGASRLPGGAKPAPPQTQTRVKDSIAEALRKVKPFVEGEAFKSGKLDRPKLAAMFIEGAPAESKINEQKYQELLDKGLSPVDARRQAKENLPAIPKIPQSILSVALDIAIDGGISQHGGPTGKGNVGNLHKQGIIVNDLGYKLGGKPRPKPSGQGVKAPPAAPNPLNPFGSAVAAGG